MGLELTPAAKALLAEKGYDPMLGARPLRRTIQREIEDILSEKILFGELTPGEIVVVDTEGEAARSASSPSAARPSRRWCPTPRRSVSSVKRRIPQRSCPTLSLRTRGGVNCFTGRITP